MAKDTLEVAGCGEGCERAGRGFIIPDDRTRQGIQDIVEGVFVAPCAQEDLTWRGTAPAPKGNIDTPSQ